MTNKPFIATSEPTSTSRLSAALDHYRDRRATRALHARIERELSTYRTEAELHELDAMLERSEDVRDSVYVQMIERIRLRAA